MREKSTPRIGMRQRALRFCAAAGLGWGLVSIGPAMAQAGVVAADPVPHSTSPGAGPSAVPMLPAADPSIGPPRTPSAPLEPDTVATPSAPLLLQSPGSPAPVAPIYTARVLSVTSMAQPVSTPRMACTEYMEAPATTSGVGALAGAVLGAAVGSQVGGGSGQVLATAAGAVAGAVVGDRAEQGDRTQSVRRCAPVEALAPVLMYQVLYELGGQHHMAILPYHPGATLQIQLTPVAASPLHPSSAPTAWSPQAVAAVVYGPVGPVWRGPVVVGVGLGRAWGKPHRRWHGHSRRW